MDTSGNALFAVRFFFGEFRPRQRKQACEVITGPRRPLGAPGALSARLLRLQDDERRRLGRELHDIVGQLLAGIKLSLKMLEIAGGERKKLQPRAGGMPSTVLEVEDRSKGLPPETVEAGGRTELLGVRLRGITERVRELGGMLKLTSSENGTIVRATVPATASEAIG